MEGKLGHKKFDFTCFNMNKAGRFLVNSEPYKCGTIGCALGECPVLFKKGWRFDNEGTPILREPIENFQSNSWLKAQIHSEMFFGISAQEANHLFFPDCQKPYLFGGKMLSDNATRKQVAKNILAFIEVKKNKKKQEVKANA